MVSGPGSGIPSASRDSDRKPQDMVAPTIPATRKNRRYSGQVGFTVVLRLIANTVAGLWVGVRAAVR